MSGLFWLETEHEGKPGGILQSLSGLDTIDTDTIVESEESEHGQEESHTDTGASTKAEGIIVFEIKPTIGRFEEREAIDGATWVRHQRVAHFQLIFIEDGKESTRLLLIGIDGGVRILIHGITTLSNDIITQETIVIRETSITQLESFKR